MVPRVKQTTQTKVFDSSHVTQACKHYLHDLKVIATMTRTLAHSLDFCSTFTRYVAALQHFRMLPTLNWRFTEIHVTIDDLFVCVSLVKENTKVANSSWGQRMSLHKII